MGSDQSTMSHGSKNDRRQQRDDQFPSTSARTLTRSQASQEVIRQQDHPQRQQQQTHQAGMVEPGRSPKHNIVVVADGSVVIKDPDPELTRLHTIPSFLPIIHSSLNLSSTASGQDMCERLDYRQLLRMCLRYQKHLQQLAEAVVFDQNALCFLVKEVSHSLQLEQVRLNDRQKRYQRYAAQFERVTEISTALDKVKAAMENIAPCLDRLNCLLPSGEQLEPCTINVTRAVHSIQAD